MGEKRITISETDAEAFQNGHIFNHVKGYAYLNEETGDITFTKSAGDFAKVTGRAHIDIEKKKPAPTESEPGIGGIDPGNAVAGGITILGIILFLISIPLSWWELSRSYSEFPVECGFMVLTAIACIFVAYIKGFKIGIATCAIVCTLFEIGLAIYNHDLSIWHFIGFPIMFAGFGVMPSGIGHFARFVHKKLLKNRP